MFFSRVFERVFDLQRDQTAQAGLVFGGGDLGFVKHLYRDRVACIYQSRKADQGLLLAALATANFQ